jgi:hypothetical protein
LASFQSRAQVIFNASFDVKFFIFVKACMGGAAENRSKEGVAANHRTDLKKIFLFFLK